MIQIAPQMRILVAVEPVDFRKGIDGMAGVCRKVLGSDPFFCGGPRYVTWAALVTPVLDGTWR